MIHTQTEIDNLVELAIIQRAELKKLVESLPQLRDHLSSEIERNLEEIEPAIRSELEQFVTARALDAHAQTSTALTAKIDELARSLETTTAARYSVLIAEREKNESLLAQAEARIAEAASALPGSVKEIVAGELARFPRAGEIDQLRKEFAEPKGLNPRGKWSPDESYQRLDLVTFNGDSFVSNIDGNRERPSRSAADWTLNAARGNSGGGGGVSSITDLLPVPTDGQILGSVGPNYVPKNLVAGANITISETDTDITIAGTEGQIELTDGTAAAPSLFFVNDTDTGLFRPGSNELGISVGGVQQAVVSSTTFTITPNLVVSGTGTINGTTIPASKTLVVTTDKISALAATTSAELAGVISDETGTGSLVFASSPTLVTPDLGTPSALVGTNITGTAAGLTAGNVTTNANLTGDVTSVGNATSIAAGVIVDADINASAGIADTKLATISTASKVSNSATTATSANTASAIVARDGSGNFTAGTITANLTGNVSGSSGSTTGNAATATALQTARAINGVNFDGTAPITVTADAGTLTGATLAAGVTASSLTSVGTLGSLTVTNPISGSVTGSSGSTTGNAATATALATARAINGVNFDGTAAITVTAAAGTLSGNTLAAGVTASSLTSLGTIANLTATAGTVATTPTASTDIANKLYVDTVAQGLDAKASCVAATTADITLSGAQTIDGVSVVAGNRVLVKNQSLSQNNGIYLCASGSWTRTTDANTWDALTSAFTFIEQGTVNADTGYVCTANAGGTLGTTALPWSQFSGAGTFTAGTGLTLTGSVFSLTSPVAVANGGTGLTSLGSGVATFLGTPSSANLAAAVSDETGSGALVFANSPTLVTPALGTPSSGTVTNLTGTASININGTVGATTPSTGVFTGLTVNDNSTLGSSNTDTVTFNARSASDFNPSADDTYDLGVTGHEWRNLNIDGTANIDSLVADTADINGGTIDGTTIGATTPSTVAATTGTFTDVLKVSPSNGFSQLQLMEGAGTTFGWRFLKLGPGDTALRLSNTADNFSAENTVATFTSTGLNSTAIGATTPSTGAFTTLSATPGSGVSGLTVTGNGAGFFADFVATNLADSGIRIRNTGTGGRSYNLSTATDASGNIPGAGLYLYDSTGAKLVWSADTNSRFNVYNGLAVTGALSSTTGANFATSSGNVGVGTTNPSNKFVVSNAGAEGLEIAPTGTASNPTILSYNRTTSAYGQLTLASDFLVFFTNGTSERLRIDSSGNVGIGTASPGSKLDVNGEIRIGNTVNNVTATLPNRTITMVIGGTTYYIHAKTTND